ncbi:unnamed protein product [Echinostoma caproni]|uniref:Uncharacterized protein n=1 Tax=Echinostoma caproni TaxID=27848 RepID=A0A183AGW0_9TREM|nr:unnamed protein product [Echinostoma caproni]
MPTPSRLNKRATYLTISPPRPDHSRHVDSIGPGPGPCTRDTCNTDHGRMSTHASGHLILAFQLWNVAAAAEIWWIT